MVPIASTPRLIHLSGPARALNRTGLAFNSDPCVRLTSCRFSQGGKFLSCGSCDEAASLVLVDEEQPGTCFGLSIDALQHGQVMEDHCDDALIDAFRYKAVKCRASASISWMGTVIVLKAPLYTCTNVKKTTKRTTSAITFISMPAREASYQRHVQDFVWLPTTRRQHSPSVATLGLQGGNPVDQ